MGAFLLPQFTDQGDQLFFVKNEYNGVVIESGFADKHVRRQINVDFWL